MCAYWCICQFLIKCVLHIMHKNIVLVKTYDNTVTNGLRGQKYLYMNAKNCVHMCQHVCILVHLSVFDKVCAAHNAQKYSVGKNL